MCFNCLLICISHRTWGPKRQALYLKHSWLLEQCVAYNGHSVSTCYMHEWRHASQRILDETWLDPLRLTYPPYVVLLLLLHTFEVPGLMFLNNWSGFFTIWLPPLLKLTTLFTLLSLSGTLIPKYRPGLAKEVNKAHKWKTTVACCLCFTGLALSLNTWTHALPQPVISRSLWMLSP